MNVKTRTKKQMSSLTKRSLQRFAQNKLAVAGAIGLILIVLACACAPLLTHYDPGFIDPANRSLAPSKEHLLGTDRVGRDIFARILYGGRWSLLLALRQQLVQICWGRRSVQFLVFTVGKWTAF